MRLTMYIGTSACKCVCVCTSRCVYAYLSSIQYTHTISQPYYVLEKNKTKHTVPLHPPTHSQPPTASPSSQPLAMSAFDEADLARLAVMARVPVLHDQHFRMDDSLVTVLDENIEKQKEENRGEGNEENRGEEGGDAATMQGPVQEEGSDQSGMQPGGQHDGQHDVRPSQHDVRPTLAAILGWAQGQHTASHNTASPNTSSYNTASYNTESSHSPSPHGPQPLSFLGQPWKQLMYILARLQRYELHTRQQGVHVEHESSQWRNVTSLEVCCCLCGGGCLGGVLLFGRCVGVWKREGGGGWKGSTLVTWHCTVYMLLVYMFIIHCVTRRNTSHTHAKHIPHHTHSHTTHIPTPPTFPHHPHHTPRLTSSATSF